MNPRANIEAGSQVIVTKFVSHTRSNVQPNQVGKLFSVMELEWDGRTHNRFVSSVYIKAKDGSSYKAIVDQLASVNANYEPMGDIIVCTACGVTMYEDELVPVRGLDHLTHCPHCGTIDPSES